MFKNLNYSLTAMLVFGTRLVIFGASVGDSIALASLCALYAYSLYIEAHKPIPLNNQIRLEIDQIRTTVEALKIARVYGTR